MRARVVLCVVFTLSLLIAAAAWQPPATGNNVDRLAWISGSWQTKQGMLVIEEHWTRPAAGTMIGMGRTISGDTTVFFEYLRIESRPQGLFYVAHPKGSPGTDFRCVRGSEAEAVFENPTHDFPKRIIYRKNADGSITARIEGNPGDKERAEEFLYQRMK